MSFQAYLNTVEKKTGKNASDLRTYAADKGWTNAGSLRPEIKAGAVIADLKQAFGLGHGHAMAVFALLKGTKREGDT